MLYILLILLMLLMFMAFFEDYISERDRLWLFIGAAAVMALVALTGAVSHVSLGAQIFPGPMAVVVLSCLLGAVTSAKFANRCEIKRLNRIVGIVLILLGIVTITIKLL